jgi:hypothetical protein
MLGVRIFTVIFPLVVIISVGYFYARFRPIKMTAINRLKVAIFSLAVTTYLSHLKLISFFR